MAKMYRILEICWLLLTIASVAVALYFIVKYQPADSYIFWAFAPLSLLMYYIRRRSRLQVLKNNPKTPL
jgi:hypothetical protein